MLNQITDTTDGKYIGTVFNTEDNPIQLAPDVFIYIDKRVPLPNGTRYINSSYIIDAIEVVPNG